jgi:hypothetical protein
MTMGRRMLMIWLDYSLIIYRINERKLSGYEDVST